MNFRQRVKFRSCFHSSPKIRVMIFRLGKFIAPPLILIINLSPSNLPLSSMTHKADLWGSIPSKGPAEIVLFTFSFPTDRDPVRRTLSSKNVQFKCSRALLNAIFSKPVLSSIPFAVSQWWHKANREFALGRGRNRRRSEVQVP